jgi:hypothetical protein
MKTTIQAAAAAITLIASSAAHAQEAVQWRVQDGGNGHWYALRLTEPGIAWATAQSSALSQGGHLATLTSAEENSLVFSIANIPAAFGGSSVVGPWLGGAREGPNWSWVTGEKWGFANWLPPNPDGPGTWGENRTCLTSSEGRWNDFNDSGFQPGLLMRSYIVEWSADCNGDGIVDYGQCRDGTLADYNGNNVPDCCERGEGCVVGNYPVQWRVEDGGNGHWYKINIIDVAIRYAQARPIALAQGGDLASIADDDEYRFIVPLLLRATDADGCYPAVYQGLARLPGEPWKWSDGTPFQWSVWGNESDPMWPQGKLGLFAPGSFEPFCVPHLLWDDGPLDALHPLHRGIFIEWSADCNNEGIVDYGQILQGQLVDSDVNGVPDICEVDPCPGDITNGGTVDAADLSILLAAWGTNGQAEFDTDIDGSGLVDGGDLALVLGGWGPCPQ